MNSSPDKNLVTDLKESFMAHLKYSLVKDKFSASKLDQYLSIALTVRDHLVEKWIRTQESYYVNNVKKVYYLSMEYLIGRSLTHNMINLDLQKECRQTIREIGHKLEELEEMDVEPGLGNGGLGRLAVCFMESLASLGMPAQGYGIRYEFGIFHQKIQNGYQTEMVDNWLHRGNPWEIPRPQEIYPIKFYGHVKHITEADGREVYSWVDSHDDVLAMAYDIPVPGYRNGTVNNLRLWGARSTRELDFKDFNAGDYLGAVWSKQETETISKVLYPNDTPAEGKTLRLKQEYFFVSASLQDIVRQYKKNNSSLLGFPEKVAIQLNDTHPALAIPELMRIMVDQEGLQWEDAWDLTVKTMSYTNHTILPEALEKWPVKLFGTLLPRHLQIVYEINYRFLKEVEKLFPNDRERLRRMSIVEEDPQKSVCMANLAIVGSHRVNGVSELHSNIVRSQIFKDFHEMYPDRFINITNGISQRHWLKACNPKLAGLITKHIGDSWITKLDHLKQLQPLIDNRGFCKHWREAKQTNKINLARYVADNLDIVINPESVFDVQIKRIHEYKRQLLNILHAVVLFNRIKKAPQKKHLARTIIFSGKAAPGYYNAKLIIKLITSVADKVNNDADVRDRLKVIFIPNYSVSIAEKIIPAADISEQISTAGMEASGTGNMKLALNGALTVGTLDGANIEIRQQVGEENFYRFGLTAKEVQSFRQKGYDPKKYYLNNRELKQVLDMVQEGYFSPEDSKLFCPIIDSLIKYGDYYMVLADFQSYCDIQKQIELDYQNENLWTQKTILNASAMGRFSGDRAITEYVEHIWKIKPVPEAFSLLAP
jgi:starch phosphorylase